ncbi:MAG: U32 family peptidase [Marinifilaceae bacterium]|jgi:putative protease|nr:U32 family peptidase [Marinifilaceae bacterium]
MENPELLMPVGNIEMFHAAVEAGADAIYLGLKQFNARGRATNFSPAQVRAMKKIADKNKMKIYITLNTVIKNSELPALIDTLSIIEQLNISALIIQDWGTYYIIKKYFPNIPVHASTQMANHNSVGCNYSEKLGFERVVIARETTMQELKSIKKNTKIELEVFVHGALCYSFSGMCMFSSFLGGNGANRGLCTQPCRRIYSNDKESHYLFSLKDNNAILSIPELKKLKVESLKIEGRLKPAEYVYKVASAYRKAIDKNQIDEAQQELMQDMGREKTSYFLGGNVSESISDNTNTGLLVGEVVRRESNNIKFTSNIELKPSFRIRIKQDSGDAQKSIKLNEVEQISKELYQVEVDGVNANKGNQVYVVGMSEKKFSSKLADSNFNNIRSRFPFAKKQNIIKSLSEKKKNHQNKEELYIRIAGLNWLKKVDFRSIDFLIINLNKTEWEKFEWNSGFLQKNSNKIIIELPKFIPEKDIDFYKALTKKASNSKFRYFSISHLSQKMMLPKNSRFMSNENVYAFNDAAIKHLKSERVLDYCYPIESEIDNLFNSKNRDGIIPIYFFPDLFYSRMPIKAEGNNIKDSKKTEFVRKMKNGMTIIHSVSPVAWFQAKPKLQKSGFNKFLIDFSNDKLSSNVFKRVIKHYKNSQQIQPSTSFNFKKGMK